MRLEGNAEVVDMLRLWLKEARKGEITYAAMSIVKGGDRYICDHAGCRGTEAVAQKGLKLAYQQLGAIQVARSLGPRDFNLDASMVEWPLTGMGPFNWDFLVWLIDAEMTRRRLGAPPPLRVAFTRQETLTSETERNFFENVIRPMPPLIGAIEDDGAKGGRHKRLYVTSDICVAARAGEPVPKVQASKGARDFISSWLHGAAPVTITLREAGHYAQRNSNIEAWLKFAGDLKRKGENVVFLRDTAKANEPLPGFATLPRASIVLDARCALYEAAKVNLFISNGPGGLAIFGDRPYIYFCHIRPDEGYAANNPGWWEASNGVREGDQWPWALPTQHMVWKEDTYQNLSEAWEKYGIAG